MNIKNFIINIPYNIKLLVWSNNFNNNKTIMMVSKNKKFILNLDYNKIQVDKWNNSLIIKDLNLNSEKIKINNIINNFLRSWDKYFYSKIKFKGKGFRIRFFKKIKLVKFFFGRSHKTFYLINNIKKKRVNKYKFILTSINKKNMIKLSKNLVNIKKINLYTLRGLRLSRQIIFKRKGKKGTYI